MLTCWAFALIAADAVTVNTHPRVNAPDTPSLTIVVHDPIDGAVLDLHRDDGQVVHFEVPRTSRGSFKVDLAQPIGRAYEYDGELRVNFQGGEGGSIPLHLSAEVTSSLKAVAWANLDDVRAHVFRARLNAPAGKVELEALAEDGRTLPKRRVAFNHEPAGTELVVSWGEQAVLRIDATFFDDQGVPQKSQLFPWYVEIPHDDVNFATGKYEVAKSEEAKLLVLAPRIREAAAKARTFVAAKLFIVGYTDTVGDAADNLRLSRLRARSLAVFLHGHGVDLPFAYAGVGETMLAVATPDNTDNAQNRRARYILAVSPPPLAGPVEWQDY